jgi:hypothetical protein
MNVKEYLEASLKSDNEDICHGWKYMENNITDELTAILKKPEYWALFYNDQKRDFIVKETGAELDDSQLRQLGSFVYIYNGKKGEAEALKREQEILNSGYIKITGGEKEYDGRKVKCIMLVNGILGDREQEIEGKLRFVPKFNTLAVMPKRAKKTGYVINQFAYIKFI